jgi:hypothetical protein
MESNRVVETPELDKLKAINDAGLNATVQEFLEWLQSKGYLVARYLKPEEKDDYGYWGGMPVPVAETHEQLMADFFEIDMRKVSEERDAVYRALVSAQEAT